MFLYPKLYLNSVKEITLQMLEQNNIKGLILDVDNTLIDFDKKMPEGVKEWAENLKQNNIKLYIYAVNDLDAAREYRKKGAAGICSDYLLDTDLDFDKKGIKINYEN